MRLDHERKDGELQIWQFLSGGRIVRVLQARVQEGAGRETGVAEAQGVPLELPPFGPIGEVLVLGYDVCYKRWIDLENKSNCGVVLNVAPDDGQLNNWLAQSSILHVFPVSDARPDGFVNKKL